MLNKWRDRYGRVDENNMVYRKLLDELNAATNEIFKLRNQLTPEQVNVLDRYMMAFCRIERYKNLLERREADR